MHTSRNEVRFHLLLGYGLLRAINRIILRIEYRPNNIRSLPLRDVIVSPRSCVIDILPQKGERLRLHSHAVNIPW